MSRRLRLSAFLLAIVLGNIGLIAVSGAPARALSACSGGCSCSQIGLCGDGNCQCLPNPLCAASSLKGSCVTFNDS